MPVDTVKTEETLKDLKVRAYDIGSQIGLLQQEGQTISNEIRILTQELAAAKKI